MLLNLKYIILTMILPLIAAGCTDVPEATTDKEDKNIRLELNPVISTSAVTTRAAVNSTEGILASGTYDFGMYIYRFKDNEPNNGYNPHNNSLINFLARYDKKDSKSSWEFTIDNYVYDFLSVKAGIPYDVYAYHPYTEGADDPEKVPFDSSKAQDWLVSKKVLVNVEPTSDVTDKITVPLEFEHLMTCIVVNVRTSHQTYPYVRKATLSGSESRIGMKGYVNVMTKETYITEMTDKIEFNYGSGGLYLGTSYRTFQFIFPEIENVEKDQMKFTLTYKNRSNDDTKEYKSEYTLPMSENGASFKRGTKYVYNLLLDHVFTFEGMTIEQEGEWETEEKSELII